MKIEKINGVWLVNNKPYKDLSFDEKEMLNEFFKSIKKHLCY